MKQCKKCSLILTEDNCYPSDWKRGGYICKFCRKLDNKNVAPDKQKKYSKTGNLVLKQQVLDVYGNECQCCGENIWQFLTIDHIDGEGSTHRKDIGIGKRGGTTFYQWLKNNNFPRENFRTLCYNCNCCSGYNGFCAHQISKNNLENCFDCGIKIIDNIFEFYKANNMPLCKNCVISRSVKREDAKDETINYHSLLQRRRDNKSVKLNRRQKVIEGYGGICQCCGENDYLFLSIDHINNNGAEERKIKDTHDIYRSLIKNNYPQENYRLLCYNCNCCRGSYSECYHELCRKLSKNDISISEYKDIMV